MSTSSFLSRLSFGLLIASLLAIGLFFQFKETQAAAVAKNRLDINIARLFSSDAEPRGFVVSADGWTHLKFFVTEHPQPLPTTTIQEVKGGVEIGQASFYHAGMYDTFVVKRLGSTLQVIRQSADEMSPQTIVDRHVVFSGYVPRDVRIDTITSSYR